jgi:hypothetical protein
MKRLRKGVLFFYFVAVIFSQAQAENSLSSDEQISRDYANQQIFFFNDEQNFKDYANQKISELSAFEIEAFKTYTNESWEYRDINQFLRKPLSKRIPNRKTPNGRIIDDTIKYIDSALRRSETPKEATVYRGMALTTTDVGELLNLKNITSKYGEIDERQINANVTQSFIHYPYMSSSFSKDTAADLACNSYMEHPEKNRLVLLTIHVPRGANALYLTENLSYNSHERELLIMHDQELKLRPNGAKYEIVKGLEFLCMEVDLIPRRLWA